MKILLVQESDWLTRNPHQQHHLMDRLSVRGHEIHVIDYAIDWRQNTENKSSFIKEREIFNNVNKVNPNAKIKVIRPSVIQLPIFDYISIPYYHGKEINKEIKEFKPDLIIAFGLLNARYAVHAAKKNKIPFVYYLIDVLYTLIPEKIFQEVGKKIMQNTLKKSDLVITINNKLSELAINLGASKESTVLIDAGIDLNKFEPHIDTSYIKKQYNILEEDTVLFFMGWIYNFAGMKELAVDLGENKSKYPHIKILVVGDGDAHDDMINIQKKYHLEDQLILTGKQPYDLIPQFTATADICLLPAYQNEEIMQNIVPIKLYEYLAMEKPVIATKLPGIYKEFGENHGINYVNNAKEVLKLSQYMIKKDIIREEGLKGRKFVESNDWEYITDKFEKTLEKLL